jgi:hypothetical protein
MQPGRRAVRCDASALPPTLATIDHLARAQLAARREAAQVRLRNVSLELADLVAFAGLAEVLRVEVERQPEDGEQRGGVEKECELGDPPA